MKWMIRKKSTSIMEIGRVKFQYCEIASIVLRKKPYFFCYRVMKGDGFR